MYKLRFKHTLIERGNKMSGQIKKMIDKIISEKAKGDNIIENSVKVKLILKGIKAESYDLASPDDPEIIKKLTEIAKDYKITV